MRIPAVLLFFPCVVSTASPPSPADPSAPAAPPAAAAAPEKSAPAPSTEPATADEAFNTRVKTLEEQVTDLKEKIFRSKARLLLLQETVLGGDLSAGARAVLMHRSEMGSTGGPEKTLTGVRIIRRTPRRALVMDAPPVEESIL